MHKKQVDNESQSLINYGTALHENDDHHRHRSSRLEWAESSWTRFPHALFWWWIAPVLSLGSKQTLSQDDLDNIPHIDKSSILFRRLHSYDWISTVTWKIVVREFWKEFLYAGLLYFPFISARIAQPLLLRLFVLHINNNQGSLTELYLYALLLFICAVAHTFTSRLSGFRTMRVGVRIRNALISVIYERALSIKMTALQQTSTGQMINLIANDAGKFEEMSRVLHYAWEGPLEATIVFSLLGWIMGLIPTLAGLFTFCFFIAIEIKFNRRFREYHEITAMCNDKRVHAFNEFIHGCHIVKMYNWEKPMEDRIHEIRETGFITIKRASVLRAINMTRHFVFTPLLALATFSTAWLLDYPLDAANVFATLAFFAFIRMSVGYYLPKIIELVSELQVASARIDSFMCLSVEQAQELPSSTISTDEQQKGSIIMLDASFSWYTEIPCLSALNLTIGTGTLVGIVGPVGAGKSSLLTAILGEMNLINGQFNTNHNSFSYAAQSPWIFSDTLRNNILLNRPFDIQRYRNVIHACCLDVDLSLLGSTGDMTIIGERGINLSGGQKARVSLARALYFDADIYLLDDPFASVDGKVAKEIYERCIGSRGLLQNKTRLLVTHQTQFLTEAHQTIFLQYGHIDEEGYLDNNSDVDDDTDKDKTLVLSGMFDEDTAVADPEPIISQETSADGGVGWSVWWRLFTAPPFGISGLCLLIVLLLVGEIFYDVANYWLSLWVKRPHTDEARSPKYAYVYLGLTIATILADAARTSCYFFIILNGSNYLHNNMLKGLLYTSIQFFESNPNGRILNRVSKDQQVIDEVLPVVLLNGVKGLLTSVGSVVIICCVNPYILPIFIILVPMFWMITRYYLRSSRQIKRLENVTRSPIYALFSSSLNGLPTIRAFKAKNDFIKIFTDKIDANTRAFINMEGVSQWYSTRLDLISSLVMLMTTIFLIFLWHQLHSSSIALSMMYAISLPGWFHWTILQLSDADLLMTSAERVHEYGQLPREEDESDNERLVKTPPEWPAHGTIEFRDYGLRHRSNLEYVIKNINLRIESSQKIGIIGRTGAGKSSLFKGIFRFLHRSNVHGQILIDDVDISRITLNHLRSHLSVIPQQPVLFSGTLRYNLDPFDQYTDEQCWMALEDVQLKPFVSSHSNGLLMSVAESGNNLSVGECQLICIARAILKKSKILLIDEATANVDQQTDQFIQTVIADKFQDRTVMTIAHRLSTVAKNDCILVLDKGMIVNYDTAINILHTYQ